MRPPGCRTRSAPMRSRAPVPGGWSRSGGESPFFVGFHRRELASPACDLDVAADADAELPRFPSIDACGLFLTQFGVSGRTKRDVKGTARIPAVVVGAGRGAVRE